MYQMINISNWILQHLFYIHITITYIQDAQHRSLFTGPDPNAEWLLDGCCPVARPPPACLRCCAAQLRAVPGRDRPAGRREHRRSRAGGRSTLLRGSAATPRGGASARPLPHLCPAPVPSCRSVALSSPLRPAAVAPLELPFWLSNWGLGFGRPTEGSWARRQESCRAGWAVCEGRGEGAWASVGCQGMGSCGLFVYLSLFVLMRLFIFCFLSI